MALLQQLAVAARTPANGKSSGRGPKGPADGLVVRDERTGASYLKVALPAPEVLDGALKAIGTLLESLRGGASGK
jgi:hypothetical protein